MLLPERKYPHKVLEFLQVKNLYQFFVFFNDFVVFLRSEADTRLEKIDSDLVGITDNGSKLVWGISASELPATSERYLPKASAIRLSSVHSMLLAKVLLIVF